MAESRGNRAGMVSGHRVLTDRDWDGHGLVEEILLTFSQTALSTASSSAVLLISRSLRAFRRSNISEADNICWSPLADRDVGSFFGPFREPEADLTEDGDDRSLESIEEMAAMCVEMCDSAFV
jgi:hypothetical protein